MDEKIQRLNGIAQQGDIDAFYNIIREDVKLLERIDEFPFVDTPLHKSALAGQSPFSCEMMILKPSFVNKRNPDGYTPICLALLNGHTEMVRQLLQHNADLVRVKGRESMTPLHYAAKTEREDYLALLEIFLSVCRDSIKDLTTDNETALHIALKNNNLEAFKFLVGWLLRKWPYSRKIMDQKDVKGNTVLHIAVSRNQTPAVSHLLDSWGGIFVNINEKNLEGKTALDILEGQRRQGVDNIEMRVILESAGALTASSLPTVTSYAHYLRLPGIGEEAKRIFSGNPWMETMSDGKRNAMLVVAVLIVTLTYQAAITPPGGLWQDDLFKPNTTDILRRSPDDLYELNITAPHRAGSAIAGNVDLFWAFVFSNSLLFFSSVVAMFFLIPPGKVSGFIFASYSLHFILSYFCSIVIMGGSGPFAAFFSILLIIMFVVMSIAAVGLSYLLSLIRKEKLKKKYSRA